MADTQVDFVNTLSQIDEAEKKLAPKVIFISGDITLLMQGIRVSIIGKKLVQGQKLVQGNIVINWGTLEFQRVRTLMFK